MKRIESIMQGISIPSHEGRNNRLYIVFQCISSCLILVGAFGNFINFPDYFHIILTINAFIFFLILLGTNFLILIKKNGQISFETFIILEICIGTFIQYAAGLISYFSRFPYYSEITEVVIAGANISIVIMNHMTHRHISIYFNKDTKPLIVIGLAFLVIRLLTIIDKSLYIDDQALFEIAQRFTGDTPSILPLYDGSNIEIPYEIAFAIGIGIVLKFGWTASSIFSLFLAKTYLIALTTFLIFPVYAFLARIIKERKSIFIMLGIIVGNQIIFMEGSYLLTSTLFMVFFTTSFYYFILVLEKDGPANENLIICTIAGTLAIATRYNAIPLCTMQVIIYCIILVLSKIEGIKNRKKTLFGSLCRIPIPKFTSPVRLLLFQVVALMILYGTYNLAYFFRNGLTIVDFGQRMLPFGYFGRGNLDQFTPVDGFSFAWMWERLSYNLPWFFLHFSQLAGFFHVYSGDALLRLMLNYQVSIILVIIIGCSMIYTWYKTSRKFLLSAFYQVSVFLLSFASIILWGETDFQFYRWLFPFLIMLYPPVYGTIKEILTGLKRTFKLKFDVEQITAIVILPFLVITLYGTLGCILPFFLGNPSGYGQFF